MKTIWMQRAGISYFEKLPQDVRIISYVNVGEIIWKQDFR